MADEADLHPAPWRWEEIGGVFSLRDARGVRILLGDRMRGVHADDADAEGLIASSPELRTEATALRDEVKRLREALGDQFLHDIGRAAQHLAALGGLSAGGKVIQIKAPQGAINLSARLMAAVDIARAALAAPESRHAAVPAECGVCLHPRHGRGCGADLGGGVTCGCEMRAPSTPIGEPDELRDELLAKPCPNCDAKAGKPCMRRVSFTPPLEQVCVERAVAVLGRRSPSPESTPGRWRVGRKLGRTLYRDDVCVGLVDTAKLAAEIVAAMNRAAHGPDWPHPGITPPEPRG